MLDCRRTATAVGGTQIWLFSNAFGVRPSPGAERRNSLVSQPEFRSAGVVCRDGAFRNLEHALGNGRRKAADYDARPHHMSDGIQGGSVAMTCSL